MRRFPSIPDVNIAYASKSDNSENAAVVFFKKVWKFLEKLPSMYCSLCSFIKTKVDCFASSICMGNDFKSYFESSHL